MSVKLPKVPLYGRNVKLWGWTQTVALTDKIHVANAFIMTGGFSSKHYHDNLWNRFVIVDGILQIEIYRNDKQEIVKLDAGDVLDVEPKLWHRMKSIEETKLIEIYWPQEGCLDPEDIVREDQGGLSSPIVFIPTIFPVPHPDSKEWFQPPPVEYQPFYNDNSLPYNA